MADLKTLDFPFLTEATKLLIAQGWDPAADEVKYPIFSKSFPSNQCRFVYQAMPSARSVTLTWLVHTRNDQLNAIYGQLAETKFDDLPLRRTTIRRVVQDITPDDIVILTDAIENWINQESGAVSITNLAQSSPRFAYQWQQRITALVFLEQTDDLANLLKTSERPPAITDGLIKRAISLCEGD